MKTQIIHLESHDDTNSVKDKMDWSQTPRVLLIWPENSRLLTERLDLILLERHSTSMGSQLALVTSQPDVKIHAKEAGIPVFPSKEQAQSSPWHRSRRFYRRRRIQDKIAQPRKRDLRDRPQVDLDFDLPPWAQLAVFTAGVFAVLFIATLFLPRAEITIPPQEQWQEMTLPVRASPAIQNVHVSGAVPVHEVSVSIEKRAQKPTSGILAIPDTYATGTVQLTNLTDHENLLPANTVLNATKPQPFRYRTLREIRIPAGYGQQVDARIKALQPGVKGNQPRNASWGISADIGADLAASNPQPITGGRDVYVSTPTKDDRELLERQVFEELKEASSERLRQKLNPDDILFSDAPTLEKIEEKRFIPSEGEPGDILELVLRVQFSGWVVKDKDLKALAREIIKTSQRSSEYQTVPGSLALKHEDIPSSLEDGEANWSLTIKWRQDPVIERQDIIHLVLGQTPSRAQNKIDREFNLEPPAHISTRPSWWPRLPFIPFRIDVQ